MFCCSGLVTSNIVGSTTSGPSSLESQPDWTAKNIGWEKSPFQYEIGFAGIAIASLGLVSYWLHDLFWVATAIAAIIFYWGCASGHIRDMIKLKNFNPGNAGYVFWWDILMPLAIIILLLIKNYS